MDDSAAARVRALSSAFADPVAFRHWYDDAVVTVYGYLLPRCGGDEALAEELTQETFIQAIDKRWTYAGRASSSTWLCSIARNKLADHYRETDRVRRRHLQLVVREVPVEGGARARPADRIDDREDLLTALRTLPDLQRAAVMLVYVDGLSVREASAILHRSEAATESLLSRARERLRDILREVPDER